MNPRALLCVPDAAINEALALVMGWRTNSNDPEDLYRWEHPRGECACDPPSYCSEESPRSLLGGVELRIPEASYPLYRSAVGRICGWNELTFQYLATGSRVRARAAVWVLDQQTAERLIAATK